MPDVTIIQVSMDQLGEMIETAVKNAVLTLLPKPEKLTDDKDISLYSVKEICGILRISRTRFENGYKDELIHAGMFKMGKNNSAYLMRKEDFEIWLQKKQAKAG
jgi:hypothetical protein